ncbi:MAG: TAXI family TRAP transporter solute-binding subunit [Alphaproteobacteria bacterium]
MAEGTVTTERWRGLWGQIAIVAPALIVVIAGFALAYHFVGPAPPDRVVMATGAPEGAYHAFGGDYAERFAREGITLELKNTAGSTENLALLRDPNSGVAVAFLQGGIGDANDGHGLAALGSVYLEPLWVFVRGQPPKLLSGLAGKRIAIGAPGSGTRKVALRLLTENGVTGETATLLEIGGAQAARALADGLADVAIFITSVTSATVRGLLARPGITPMSFDRADAYVRRNRFLSKIILPRGTVDLAADLPAHDLVLLAPAATIVVSPKLHPALIDLFLLTLRDVHRGGGLIEAPGAFPAPDYVTYPLAGAARRFHDNGPPLLQRFLPFWASNLADRLKIMLLPLITLLYPLFKLLPPVYSWRMRARVNRWYKQLQAIDDALRAGTITPAEAGREIDRIESSVEAVSVPPGFAASAYTLRLHIDFLRRGLAGKETMIP